LRWGREISCDVDLRRPRAAGIWGWLCRVREADRGPVRMLEKTGCLFIKLMEYNYFSKGSWGRNSPLGE
jgi:hypothetical protein